MRRAETVCGGKASEMTTLEAIAPPAWQPAFRAEFPVLERLTYLQSGSLTPLANSVRAATIDMLDDAGNFRLAGQVEFAGCHQRAEAARAHLASFLNTRPEQIGWTSNTSLAIRFALGQIDWKPEDVLISTDMEHVGTAAALAGLAARWGVRHALVPTADGDDAFLGAFAETLRREPGARLVFLSHVSCRDGRRLPVKEAVRLAHAAGIPVAIDGAQAVGQFVVDVAAIGADWYLGSGHKWLFSPPGLAYVIAKDAKSFRSDFLLPASIDGSSDLPMGRRMEIGIEGWASRAGLDAGLTMLETIGMSEIEGYVAGLSGHLRDGLAEMPGLALVTPSEFGCSSGITSFTVAGGDSDLTHAVVDAAWEKERIYIKYQFERPVVRVSIAAFNTGDEIDRLLNVLRSLDLPRA
jgi:selenocysteine lyase/cysteine desulfurase